MNKLDLYREELNDKINSCLIDMGEGTVSTAIYSLSKLEPMEIVWSELCSDRFSRLTLPPGDELSVVISKIYIAMFHFHINTFIFLLNRIKP